MKYPSAPVRRAEDEKHQISEVLVLNLKHRSDKFWSVYGALVAAGTPVEKIKRWNAMPASDYKNIEALVDAAVKDGFPEFQTLLENEMFDRYLTISAQFWSYCQMLRYISEKNIVAVILYDDRYILNWTQFSRVYTLVERRKEDSVNSENAVDFYMLQLEYYVDEYLIDSQSFFRVQATPDKCMRQYPHIPHILQGPLGASENAMLYTPEGAKFFLEKLFQNGVAKVEVGLVCLSKLPPEERAGVWTCNYPVVDEILNSRSDIFKGTQFDESHSPNLDGI